MTGFRLERNGSNAISLILLSSRGASPNSNSGELSQKLKLFRKKLQELEETERELDVQKERLQQCLKNIVDSGNEEKYPYLHDTLLTYVCVVLCNIPNK